MTKIELKAGIQQQTSWQATIPTTLLTHEGNRPTLAQGASRTAWAQQPTSKPAHPERAVISGRNWSLRKTEDQHGEGSQFPSISFERKYTAWNSLSWSNSPTLGYNSTCPQKVFTHPPPPH